MPNIVLPAHGWRPRPQQMAAWSALEAGRTRLALAWHRRFGKDEVALHWAAVSAMTRVGTLWHMLPEQAQARKAIWNAVNPKTGRRRIDDAFPMEIREVTRDQDMFIRFKNGSTWQVVGSDSYNSLVGSPPVGVVLSEYALSDPNAWAFLRPILAENGGWAMFISTPRGNNHFAKLVRYAQANPEEWFGQVLTVEDTGSISMDVINRERRELTAERGEKEAEAIISQEYYCDFNAAIPGAYYGPHMTAADREGRIGDYPWIPSLPVGTAWDLGHSDSTVIWFYQQLKSGRVRLIDVIEGSGVGVDWYAAKLRERDYAFVDHVWPHDGGHGNIRDIAGNSLEASAKTLGIRPIRVLDRDPTVQMGIQAVRQLFPMLEFNATPLPFNGESADEARARMTRACDGLRQYRRVWDEKNQRMSDNPLHDWCFTGNVNVWTRHGTCQMMDLPQTGEVMTPWGMLPYHSPQITRRGASLVEVQFTDGLTVRCTPDHSFLTENGWTSAEHLEPGTLIRSSSVTTDTSTGSATTTARPTSIASVRPLQQRQDVWCLTVPGAESFCLENGAVVHNCSNTADSLRYLARGRRPFFTPADRGSRPSRAITED